MKFNRNNSIFLFLFFLSFVANGQDIERRIDSLFDLAYSYGESYNQEKAIVYYEMADSICEETNLLDKSIRVKFNIISNYISLNDFQKATYYLNRVHSILIMMDEKEATDWHQYYMLLGSAELNGLEFEKALSCFDRSMKIANLINDSIALFESYNKIAMVYHYLGEYEKSIEISNKALTFIDANDESRAFLYRINGASFTELSNYELAITNYESAFKIYKRFGARQMTELTQSKIIKCYLFLYDDTEDEKYLDSIAIPINKQLKWYLSDSALSPVMNEQFYSMYANYLKFKGDIDMAINYASRAYQLSDSLNIQTDRMYSSEILIELVMIKAGYNSTIASTYLNDCRELFSESNSENISEFQIKYETLEKETKINELKHLKELEKSRRNIIALIASLLICSSLVVIGFLRNRQTKLKLELKLEIQEKINIAKELEHKEKELAIQIDALHNRAKIIDQLKKEVDNTANAHSVIQTFEQNYISDREWDRTIQQFDLIHKDHLTNLKEQIPNLTYNEIKLAVLLKLNYSNKSISEILNISNEGVTKAKYRFKKKLSQLDN